MKYVLWLNICDSVSSHLNLFKDVCDVHVTLP